MTMDRNPDLQICNEDTFDSGMGNKRAWDAFDSGSPEAKRSKTCEQTLKVESNIEANFSNGRFKDASQHSETKNNQGSSNLSPSEKSGTGVDDKICGGNGVISESHHGYKQCKENDKSLVKECNSNNNSHLTNMPQQFTLVEADAAEDKGSRHTMEDAWVVLSNASLGTPGKLRCSHFAIYDGHGGRLAADYARAHLHSNVLYAGLPRELMDIKGAKKAIVEGFQKTDEALLKESTAGGWQDGATAVCVWVLGQMVFIANIGDAKAVLARSITTEDHNGGGSSSCTLKAIVVTREHKAIYPQERSRIQKAGGYVGANGRLQGRLDVSRAFGDRLFKKAGVSAIPDVHSFELTEREKFMILGCDGLWGVFGPSDAVEFIERQLKEGSSISIACRRLVREAIRERHCKDNCTAILIVFKH